MADEPDTIIIGAPDPAEQHSRPAVPTTEPVRDVLSPHEVADRAGFSYHAILRAIRRGDLQAFEPVSGHYRIEVAEYERWLRRPARPAGPHRRRHRDANARAHAQPSTHHIREALLASVQSKGAEHRGHLP